MKTKPKTQATNPLNSEAIQRKLKATRKSAISLEPNKRTEFIRRSAGTTYDGLFEPVEALELEAKTTLLAWQAAIKKREQEEQKLVDIREFIPVPPKKKEDDHV